MSRMEINLPDPVLVWEIEYDMPNDKPQGVYVVRAEVGGVRSSTRRVSGLPTKQRVDR